MKISILSHNLSNNCLGRAYILAKMLSKKYEVEIIGPKLGKEIWYPVAFDKSITYKFLSLNFTKINEDLSKIDGDIIYAIKPKGASYGLSLLKKVISNRPIILDEDDWDFGIFLDRAQNRIIRSLLSENLLDINNAVYTYLLGKASFFADEITVSSSFLKRKFGGTIIPHARDGKLYNVDREKCKALRLKYNLADKKVVMFCGTVRKHKGLNIITQAIDQLDRMDIVLMIVGVNKLEQKALPKRKYIITVPPQSFTEISSFISLADLIVLPQTKSYSALGQIPAKIFDAMAMAKPIIASDISDISHILLDCGLTFKPDNVNELSIKIEYLLNNTQIAKGLGAKAKKKFQKNYSFDVVEKKLFQIINKVVLKYKLLV